MKSYIDRSQVSQRVAVTVLLPSFSNIQGQPFAYDSMVIHTLQKLIWDLFIRLTCESAVSTQFPLSKITVGPFCSFRSVVWNVLLLDIVFSYFGQKLPSLFLLFQCQLKLLPWCRRRWIVCFFSSLLLSTHSPMPN